MKAKAEICIIEKKPLQMSCVIPAPHFTEKSFFYFPTDLNILAWLHFYMECKIILQPNKQKYFSSKKDYTDMSVLL